MENDLVQQIVTVISTVGFPIVMCLFFGWYVVQRDKKELDINSAHKEEMDGIKEALNNNTLVMQKLIDKLENFSRG